MPLFGFTEEGFRPHLALAQRLLERVGCAILRGTLHVLVVEGAEEMAPTAALRALRLHRTGIAPGRICAVDQHFFALATAVQRQLMPLRTPIQVLLGIVGKLFKRIEGRVLAQVRRG
jgi:hypothetical protein